MSRRLRRNHSAAFKTKVALDAVGDGKTIAEIAHKHDVHPHQVSEWRRQLLSRAAELFGGPAATAETSVDLKALHAKIGQLALENDFFGRHARQGGTGGRKAMIDREHGCRSSARRSLWASAAARCTTNRSRSVRPIWR